MIEPTTGHRPVFTRNRALLCALLFTAIVAVLLAEAPTASAGSGRDQRIVGGVRASPGEYPWAVHLSMGCGGALYAPDLVLTAAHCVEPGGAPITVTSGSVDLDDPRARHTAVRALRVSPDYTGREADWALLLLESPVTGVPVLPVAEDISIDRGTFTVVGWGAAREGGPGRRHLREVSVPYVSDRACAEAYPDLVPAAEICAGRPEGGADACQGDSGGPLARRDGLGRWTQIGIVSWGDGCARPGRPGVYTQVSRFAEGIAEAAGALRAEAGPERAGPPR